MAGFHTHIAVSSVVGASYAWLGMTQLQLPPESAAVAGGLCAIAGILPDVDSDSGIPARETISFAAAVAPMLLLHRLIRTGWTSEQIFLVGVPTYLFIRFGLGGLLKRFTVHRGMFHSIPAILIAGMVAFLLLDHVNPTVRYFKAAAVSLGYFTHLLLDEIWSVNVAGVVPRLKKSFGSALKVFSGDGNANSACFGILILVSVGVLRDIAIHTPTGTPTATQSPRLPAPAAPEKLTRDLPELEGRPY